MSLVSPRERLLKSLEGKRTDRRPVVCPGGMMNAAIVPVMEKSGHLLPQAHSDGDLMAALARDVAAETGFENLGLPFCLTVEAEALGSRIDLGTLSCEPKIAQEAFPSVASVDYRPIARMVSGPRVSALCRALAKIKKEGSEAPVIGNVTGPISAAASIVEPMAFFRELRKDGERAHRALSYVTDFLVAYAQALLESGADLITIGDPTATGEILGPRMFEAYAVPYLNRLVDGIHSLGKKAIVHICGNIKSVWGLVPRIGSDAISVDALVSLKRLKADFPDLVTMGNLSTYLLQFGSPASVADKTRWLIRDGVDIIAPACGLSTSTGLDNLRAMTEAAKSAPG
jgi:[methyl-Co(III) methanol-specific corrinoid protein]:coenzyme M methyltransferase